jgi:selenium metabolism protein YedF
MKTLDLRSLQCPHPVIQSRKALLDEPGTSLSVRVADETARENICRLAASLNYTATVVADESTFQITLTPDSERQESQDLPATRRTVIFITSETMGSGDEELGRLLLKNYLITLTEMTDLPESIFLVNAGVKLVCAGSELLEVFDKIGCLGVDIAACGLCLEFYRLNESQNVGRATNMLEIASALQSADGIIQP